MKFPDYFPAECPPTTAKKTDLMVYRLVDNNPPNINDFSSWRELNPHQECPQNITEFQTCGISVFTSLEDIKRAKRKIPRLRKKKIAQANLTPDLGLIIATPSQNTGQSHHTWWIPLNTQPWLMFCLGEQFIRIKKKGEAIAPFFLLHNLFNQLSKQ